MGEVGVHLHDVARARAEGMPEAGQVGRSQPGSFGAVQHLDLRVLGGEAVGQAAGAVGRVVVDDQDAKACRRGVAQNVVCGGDDRLEVLGLVERGKHEPGGTTHLAAYPR